MQQTKKEIVTAMVDSDIDDSYFDKIASYFYNSTNSDALQVIDDKTCQDFNFKALFVFLDKTKSCVGQQYLYNKLRVIPRQSTLGAEKENIISRINHSVDFRESIEKHLSKLDHKNAYYISSLFQEEHRKTPKLFWLMQLMPYLSLAFIAAAFINPFSLLLLFLVVLINTVLHYWNKRVLYQYVSSIPYLVKLNSVAHSFYDDEALAQLSPQLSSSFEILDKLKRKMSIFTVEARLQGEMYALVWGIYEFFKILFLIEPIYLYKVLRSLEDKKEDIKAIFDFVGEVDALFSITTLRNEVSDICIPNINKSNTGIETDEAYHPLIPHCVKNSIDATKLSILLTGSNMSGKTSFIKTIAVNALLGMTINTCFAKTFVMPRLKIYSAIRVSDDLLNDKSYYLEEVLRIGHMINESSSGAANLFILDEIFKGTNTVERIAAGKAVLSYLQSTQNTVFVSTHDIELADLLAQEYALYHFSEEVSDKEIDFDYKIKAGKLTNKNAIRILGLNNYPDTIIKEAMSISASLMDERGSVH